jgi:putative DNA primase/helicase
VQSLSLIQTTLPKETEATEAYFRRFLVLPFEQKIAPEERDIDLADKIKKSELAGVFNWVLVGLHRIAKNRKFSECEKSKQAIEDFKKNSDSVQLFLEDENYTKSALCTIALKELHNSYKAFCSDALFKAVSNKTFASRLRAIGYEMSSKNYGTSVFIEKLEWS